MRFLIEKKPVAKLRKQINNMKYLKSFSQKANENKNYEETSWTAKIDGKEVTVTIQEVQKYLDETKAPTIELLVDDIYDMCVHKDKTDEATLKRSEESNLNYPIIIAKGEGGQWTMILDGHHRLFKAHNNQIDKIKARVLDLKNAPREYKVLFR